MKKTQKISDVQKRAYAKPLVKRVVRDNEISMVMASGEIPSEAPPDPGGYLPPDRYTSDPFKIYKA